MSSDKSIVSFLPLHYNGRAIAMTLGQDGEEIWLAQDVCEALDLHNVSQALSSLEADEKGIIFRDTPSGRQQSLTVNESGLWHLVFKSRTEAAKQFRRWLTKDVLPTLRRYGSYTISATEKLLSDELTAKHQLPPLKPRVREHAEISLHLVAVWRVLCEATTSLDNREISRLSGVGERTTRAHTRYLLQLGFIDVYETFPRHLYAITEDKAIKQSAYWQRLERIRVIFESRHRLTYDDMRLLGRQ